MRWLKGSEPDDDAGAESADPVRRETSDGAPPLADSDEAGDSPPSPWGEDEDGDAPHSDAKTPEVPLDLAELSPETIERAVRRVVARALAEDLGDRGDITAAATVAAGTTGTAILVARQKGVISGLDLVVGVFAQVDVRVEVETHVADGDEVRADDVLATIRGPLRSILTGERTALNLLGLLSGVATRTRAFVSAVEGTGAAVRDTRKTTPGLRALEKRAIRHGGGHNHRMGLSDAVLIKENHVAAAGSVSAAVRAALERAEGRHVQVEVTTLAELEEALQAGAIDVLLDNMSPDEVRRAVARARGRASLEASGGIDLETARSYASTGVQRIAVGSLTHSAPWLDVALDVEPEDLQRPDWRFDAVWNEEAPGDADGPFGHEPVGTSREEAGTGSSPDESGPDTAEQGEGSSGLFAWRERQQGD